MTSTINESDAELLAQVAALLRALGAFRPGATRAEKWRTTDQLANELRQFGQGAVNRLDRVLREHEAQGLDRLKAGMLPDRAVRRAKYPDRTTALPLWGSTELHGQPWSGHSPDRSDPPEDIPTTLVVPAGAPRVFLSHTHDDAPVALRLAEELAAMSVGSWRFETDIQQRGDIADCVREAIAETDAIVALVSRSSIASLWVLTELHTALTAQKTAILVADAADRSLLQLLESTRFPDPDDEYGSSVEYDQGIVRLLKQDYGRRQNQRRTDSYEPQVHDFMRTLPRYLSGVSSDQRRLWRPLLAFPQLPAQWSGFLELDSLRALPERLKKRSDPPMRPTDSAGVR